ncbi:MAG: haloacid dehalogenase-like hydrolase [Phycisphaerales bacterium]|nr:haloacid dehalogenase-like hydrolase [Phycisphaerales bacterium]
MLILFDIDATLITTGGAGVRSMLDAGRRLHGDTFHADGVDFAGRLDPLILRDLLRANGIDPTPETMAAMRRGYGEALTARFQSEPTSRALPGVMELLAALAGTGPTLGLLTGNFAETGSLKLRTAGIDPEGFSVRVWGDESPHDPPARDHLPGVAIERVSRAWGRAARGEEVVVIGDTPHDIACARAHGCRVLAVATGKFSIDELAHADRALPNLTDLAGVMQWLAR